MIMYSDLYVIYMCSDYDLNYDHVYGNDDYDEV